MARRTSARKPFARKERWLKLRSVLARRLRTVGTHRMPNPQTSFRMARSRWWLSGKEALHADR